MLNPVYFIQIDKLILKGYSNTLMLSIILGILPFSHICPNYQTSKIFMTIHISLPFKIY